MAIEAERLLAIFEARFTSLEKALDTARTKSKATFTAIEADGTRAEDALSKIGSRGVPGMDKLNKSLAVTRMNTANVAAQFNDIGVQLASGTSPFLIAVQQGTQLNQVFAGMGARGVLGQLAGGFTALLNPIGLATIAIIGLGGTAVQYFTEMLSGGEKSEEQLKKEAELIRAVAQEWGSAIPAVKAYFDEVDARQREQNALQAGELVAGAKYDKVRETVSALSSEMQVLISTLLQLGESGENVSALQSAFSDLEDKIENNTATAADADRVLAALNATNFAGIDDATGLAAALGALSKQLISVATSAAQARKETMAVLTLGAQQGGRVRYQSGMIDLPGSAPTPDRAPNREDVGAENDRAAARAARRNSVSEADRERESIRKLIETLQFEQDMVGKTAEQRKVANAIRQAGAYATETQKQKIEELILATERESAALKQSEDAMRQINDLGRDVLGGLVNDLRDGASGAEALANALNKVGDKLLNLALDNLFSGKGGGIFSGGGLLGGLLIPGILHKGGVAGSDGYGHGRAVSPGVFAGASRYHSGGVAGGIRPGEVPAILQRGEIVLPKNAARASSAGGRQPVSININIAGANGDQHVIDLVRQGVGAGLATYDKELNRTIGGKMQVAQVRYG